MSNNEQNRPKGRLKQSVIFLNEIGINKNQKNKNNGIQSLAHLKEILEQGNQPEQNNITAVDVAQIEIVQTEHVAHVDITPTEETVAPVIVMAPLPTPVVSPVHHSRPVASTNVTIKEKDLLRQLLVDYVDFGFPLDKHYNSKGKALAELVRTLKPEYADSIAQRVQEEGGDKFADRLREHELSVRSKQLVFPANMRERTKETLKKVYIDFHTRHAHKDGLIDYETRLQNYCYRVAGHLQNLHRTHEFISSNFVYLAQPPVEILPEGKRYSCPDKAGILQAVKNEVDAKGKNPSSPDANLIKELEKNLPSQQKSAPMEEHDPSSSDSIIKTYQLGKHLLESIDFNTDLKTADAKIEALCNHIPTAEETEIFRNLFGTTTEQKAGSLAMFRDDIVNKRLQTIEFEGSGVISLLKQDNLHTILTDFHTKHADTNALPDYQIRLAHLYFEIGMEIPDTRAAGHFIRDNFQLLVQEKKKKKAMPSPDNTQIAFLIGMTNPPAGVDAESYKHMELSYLKGKIHTLVAAESKTETAKDEPKADVKNETAPPEPQKITEDVKSSAPTPDAEKSVQTEITFTPPVTAATVPTPVKAPQQKQAEMIDNKVDLLSLSDDAINHIGFIIESFGGINKAVSVISNMKESGLTLTEMVKVKEIEHTYASLNSKAQDYFLEIGRAHV